MKHCWTSVHVDLPDWVNCCEPNTLGLICKLPFNKFCFLPLLFHFFFLQRSVLPVFTALCNSMSDHGVGSEFKIWPEIPLHFLCSAPRWQPNSKQLPGVQAFSPGRPGRGRCFVFGESNLKGDFSLEHHSYLTWEINILLMGYWLSAFKHCFISSWGVRIGAVG